MARVTLQTVADRVGVSRMTVSNAFSRPDQLSTELRTRILAAARALGYSGPDPAGRALARGTTGAIGVLLTDSLRYAFTDEIATGFLGAVVDELASTGLALTLLTTNEHGDAIPARDVAIDGALVYSCQTQSPAREWLVRRKLPLVFVDQDPVPGIASVNVDDRAGARAAAAHLIDLGHRRIGIVTRTVVGTPPADSDLTSATLPHPQRQRMLGWLDALQGAGISPVVTDVAKHDSIEAEEATVELLSRPVRPTALLCFSDVFAIGAVNAARRLGLDVPGDLSVVGFDDSPVARRSSPALTTVRQDVESKGRLAAEALKGSMERARSGTSGKVRHHVLPTELIVRASTAPAPTSA
ncbi:MAG: LacI family DNA-binding transcriptional regulator [Acidimicrobiales bacterium]